jgi:glutamate/tyrosine decarboxylase-like PLP-dependent enzyme
MSSTIADSALVQEAADRAGRFLADLPERPVSPRAEDLERLRSWVGTPLPENETAPIEVLRTLDRVGSPAATGRARVKELPTDSNGRILPGSLPEFGPPTLVCAQAGNVNSGGFDPFPELVNACRTSGAWLHVDGAFGLWARASREKRELARGLEGADSWATDGHKWLNVPYDCGIAFVRDRRALQAAMSISAAYLPADAPREPFHFTLEASRRARGIDVWAALLSLGRSGVEALVDRCCAHARRFATGLEQAGFEILNEVELNQVVVSFGDEARNHAVVQAINEEGVCWYGPTSWRSRSGMRISVPCWATTEEDVDRSLESMIRSAGASAED